MSSHKLDEISKIATNIGIIHNGTLIKEINAENLKNQLKKSLVLDSKDRTALKTVLSKAGYKAYRQKSNSNKEYGPLLINDIEAINNPDEIATMLVNAGVPPVLLKVEKEDLERYFLRVLKELELEGRHIE
ncbi:MAG TPA: hypothetical protein GX526_00350 [Thermoanaerobacterales bacterium]|nr:hypothetical protein [Thermoanaerobacterales bacterium]